MAGGTADELGATAARSTKVGDEEMSDDVRWIRSYVLDEEDGTVGTVCIYEASSPEAIHKHARARGHAGRRDHPRSPTRSIVRPDPQPATA